jgi:UDP-4-amino-4,6-dideoxy-N-acetyl-beta-L-altrosamine transaminase
VISIPYGRQDITQEDIAAVCAVLQSDWLTQGPAVAQFEALVTKHCGAKHGVAVNSATSALHIACLALDLGPGDILWTSPNTFVASANAALYCGAQVDFVDIDPRTYNMSPDALAHKLEQARKERRLPKIVMPVHFAGQACDMRKIALLAHEYGFSVIEDASHAIGGKYLGKSVGDCAYSSITVFSFHPVKIITTGEGGMAVTNDKRLAARMELLRSHGTTRDPRLMHGSMQGAWYYEQIALGFNYRMTDLQAALGASQIQRIDAYVRARHAIAQRYNDKLANAALILPWQGPDAVSAFHLYPVRIDSSRTPVPRAAVFDSMRAAGIGVNVHYIPVHTQPYFRALGFERQSFPVAEAYYADAMSLPMFPTLDESSQDKIITVLTEALI